MFSVKFLLDSLMCSGSLLVVFVGLESYGWILFLFLFCSSFFSFLGWVGLFFSSRCGVFVFILVFM